MTAFITFVGRLFSAPVARNAEAIKVSLWKPFLIDLMNAVFFVLLAAQMFNFARCQLSGLLAGLVAMIPLSIFAALGILESIGMSGFSYWPEERIVNSEHTLTNSLKKAHFSSTWPVWRPLLVGFC